MYFDCKPLQAASATRERGELEALRVQNAALLASLAPVADTPKGKASKPPRTYNPVTMA